MNKIFRIGDGKIWCGLQRIDDHCHELYREEYELISDCAARRRNDFSTARVLSRAVLAKLGVTAGSIMPGPGMAPTWPDGIIGSISHSGSLCFVAAANLANSAIGIDVQQITPLDDSFIDMILTRQEQNGNSTLQAADTNTIANIIFSAKESVYKCLSPILPPDVDFHDAFITLANGNFKALVPRMNLELEGAYAVRRGYVFTGVFRDTPAGKE